MKKTKSISKQKRIPLKSQARSQQLTFNSFFMQLLDVLSMEHNDKIHTKSRNTNENIENMVFEEEPDNLRRC